MKILTRAIKSLNHDLEKAKDEGKLQLEQRINEFLELGFAELNHCLEDYDSTKRTDSNFFSRDEKFIELLNYAEQNGFPQLADNYRILYDKLMEKSVFRDEAMRIAEVNAERVKIEHDRIGPRIPVRLKEPVHLPIELEIGSDDCVYLRI